MVKRSNLFYGNFWVSLTTIQSVRSLSLHKNVQELTVLDAISARLLMLITTVNNLQVITIGNAYLYAKSDLKTDIALSPLPAANRDFTVAYYLWPTGSMLCSLIS